MGLISKYVDDVEGWEMARQGDMWQCKPTDARILQSNHSKPSQLWSNLWPGSKPQYQKMIVQHTGFLYENVQI